MRKLETTQVDLESIKADESMLQQLDPVEVQHLAHSISQTGILLSIPIIQMEGVDRYILLSGFLEYKAYLEAIQLNPELPDRIRVYLVTKNDKDVVLAQHNSLEELRASKPNGDGKDTHTLALKVSNLESVVRGQEVNLKRLIQEQYNQIKAEIESKFPTPLSILKAFNSIDNKRSEDEIRKKLRYCGINSTKRDKIISQLQEYKQNHPNYEFKLMDIKLLTGKGVISEKKILELADKWQE
jgi:hypothetical protein